MFSLKPQLLSKLVTVGALFLSSVSSSHDLFSIYACKDLLAQSNQKTLNVESLLASGTITKPESNLGHHKTTAFKTTLSNGVKAIVKPKDESSFSNPRAEVLAYLVDQFFKFELVPPTTLIQYKGRETSIQLFVDLPTQEKSPYEVFGPVQYKQLIFDYIINNWDRHEGNYLVVNRNEVISIDHGGAFKGLGLYRPRIEYYDINIRNYLFKTEEGRILYSQLKKTLANPKSLEKLCQNWISKEQTSELIERIRALLTLAELEQK